MSDPYSAPYSSAPATSSISDLSQPLASARGWMKFVGIVFIIQGALAALSIVGIIVAWLPIWIGVLLVQSAGAMERAQSSDDGLAFKEALSKLKTYFVIQGVLYLLSIGLLVLYVIFFGAVTLAAIAHHHSF